MTRSPAAIAYGTDPLANIAQSHQEPATLTCSCPDPEAHEVAAMVARGVPLLDACRAMWGNGPEALVLKVRAEFRATFPWLSEFPWEVAS